MYIHCNLNSCWRDGNMGLVGFPSSPSGWTLQKHSTRRKETGEKEEQESPFEHQTGHLAQSYISAFKSVFILDWEDGLFEVKGGQFACKTKAPFPFIPREGEERREASGGRWMLLYRERKRCETGMGACHRYGRQNPVPSPQCGSVVGEKGEMRREGQLWWKPLAGLREKGTVLPKTLHHQNKAITHRAWLEEKPPAMPPHLWSNAGWSLMVAGPHTAWPLHPMHPPQSVDGVTLSQLQPNLAGYRVVVEMQSHALNQWLSTCWECRANPGELRWMQCVWVTRNSGARIHPSQTSFKVGSGGKGVSLELCVYLRPSEGK